MLPCDGCDGRPPAENSWGNTWGKTWGTHVGAGVTPSRTNPDRPTSGRRHHEAGPSLRWPPGTALTPLSWFSTGIHRRSQGIHPASADHPFAARGMIGPGPRPFRLSATTGPCSHGLGRGLVGDLRMLRPASRLHLCGAGVHRGRRGDGQLPVVYRRRDGQPGARRRVQRCWLGRPRRSTGAVLC